MGVGAIAVIVGALIIIGRRRRVRREDMLRRAEGTPEMGVYEREMGELDAARPPRELDIMGEGRRGM